MGSRSRRTSFVRSTCLERAFDNRGQAHNILECDALHSSRRRPKQRRRTPSPETAATNLVARSFPLYTVCGLFSKCLTPVTYFMCRVLHDCVFPLIVCVFFFVVCEDLTTWIESESESIQNVDTSGLCSDVLLNERCNVSCDFGYATGDANVPLQFECNPANSPAWIQLDTGECLESAFLTARVCREACSPEIVVHAVQDQPNSAHHTGTHFDRYNMDNS